MKMGTDEGDVKGEYTILEDEQRQVAEVMASDGPNGALLLLIAHRDGRITLRSNYSPHDTAAWMYEVGVSLVGEYPDNEWPS